MSNLLSAQQGLLTAASFQGAAFSAIDAEFYVDGNYGFDGNPGTSPGLAFRTFSPLTYQLPLWRKNNNYSQQIRIAMAGVVNQEWSAPIVSDVAIIGASAGNARQATTSGVPNGGGATWLSPTSGTGDLLTINGQSWDVSGVYFNNSATGSNTAGIVLVGGGDPPLTADAGGTVIRNCRFTGEANGIYINGGPGFLTIKDNVFFFFDSSGDIAIKAGGSGGTGYGSKILNNTFAANLTHISVGATAYGWEIAGNRFSYIDAGVTTTTQVSLSTGNNNSVHNNYFDLPYTTNGISAMFVLGTNDRWYFNEFATAVTTTIYSFGAPAS